MQVQLIVRNKINGESTPCVLILNEKVTIGRHLGSPIAVQSEGVSRHHFSLVIQGEDLLVEDLSTNGTSLNGVSLLSKKTALVKKGDVLDIPGYEFDVVDVPQSRNSADPILESNSMSKSMSIQAKAIHFVFELLEPRELISLAITIAVGLLVIWIIIN